MFAQEPVAVFEVLSKSTGWIDQSLKLHDYDATPTIRTYVLISQDVPRAMVYTRDADGRLGIESAVLLEGGGRSIEIPVLGLALPFSALYEGLELASDRAHAPDPTDLRSFYRCDPAMFTAKASLFNEQAGVVLVNGAWGRRGDQLGRIFE